MAYLTNKNGGELKITKAELKSVPDSSFSTDYIDETFIFTLKPEETPEKTSKNITT